MNGMSEPLKIPAGDNGTQIANINESYVRRSNWLITIGRTDLIDEIADDCERRRIAQPAAGRDCDPDDPNPAGQSGERRNLAHNTSAAVRTTAPGPAGLPPGPVETGTRLAVARVRRSPRPSYRHMPESQSIRG
jgi:hypothetical protein